MVSPGTATSPIGVVGTGGSGVANRTLDDAEVPEEFDAVTL